MTALPVAERWYRAAPLSPDLTLITEPHVHPIFSANMYLIAGENLDMIVDTGMGVAPLRPYVDTLRPDPDKPLICLTTHTHVDHFGAVQEFDTRLVHPLEVRDLASPPPYSLDSSDLSPSLVQAFETAGYAPLWPMLIDALPHEGYDPGSYRFPGAPATGTVSEGDVIDLGGWKAEVIHLPGHSPGQIGLWQEETGTLFSADAIYDGPLLWEGPGYDVPAYAETLLKIRKLPVQIVHGGHDSAFGRARMHEICDAYLSLWESKGLI